MTPQDKARVAKAEAYLRMNEKRDAENAALKVKIESDAKVIAALRERLKLMDDYYQTGGDLMSHMAHIAQDALAIIEQTTRNLTDEEDRLVREALRLSSKPIDK